MQKAIGKYQKYYSNKMEGRAMRTDGIAAVKCGVALHDMEVERDGLPVKHGHEASLIRQIPYAQNFAGEVYSM